MRHCDDKFILNAYLNRRSLISEKKEVKREENGYGYNIIYDDDSWDEYRTGGYGEPILLYSYNPDSQVTYSLDPSGNYKYYLEYDKNGNRVKVIKKTIDSDKIIYTQFENENQTRIEHGDGKKEILFYTVNDLGYKVLTKHVNIAANEQEYEIKRYDPDTENLTEYETNEFVKQYDPGGTLIKYFIWSDDENKFVEQDINKKTPQPNYKQKAQAKAQKYMDTFHGLFLHARHMYSNDIDNLLRLDQEEVCVSTVRANTIYGDPGARVVLMGFGDITQLYDFDAYSWVDKGGKRKSEHDPGEEDLFKIDKKKMLGVKESDFNESKYYDEGFLTWGSADVLLVSIPPEMFKKRDFWDDDYIPGLTPRETFSSGQILIKKLKQAYPGVKFIKPENFVKIKSSGQLLRLMYKLKDERDAKEIMREPLHKYEESIKYLQDKSS